MNTTSTTSLCIKISGAKIVDISSGLESEPGNKDISMIETFMKVIQETKE